MKRRMKSKRNRYFYSPLDWAVLLLTGVLVAGGIIGMAKAYFIDARPGLNTLSHLERYYASVVVVPDGETDRLEKRPVRLYGSVTTQDGVTLFDMMDQTVDDEAFGALLGSVNDTEADGTRYVLARYKSDVWGEVQYDPLTGIHGGGKDVRMTLDAGVQKQMYDLMKQLGVVGCVSAYRYTTGDTVCLATTPGWLQEGDGSYINRCLYGTTPGSTQKLLAHFLLTKAGVPADEEFTCTGRYTLRTGKTVVCAGVHGHLKGRADALGMSCNCFFAHQMEESLDLEWVKETLADMGVSVNGSAQSATLGKLPIDPPSVVLEGDTWTFSNVWNLVGQDAALQSPLWMAELAADYVTGGQAAAPKLTDDEEVRRSEMGERFADVFVEGYPMWKAGFDGYYSDRYGELISCAKTGTADELGEDMETHKTLCFVSEELGVAAYIVVENYHACGVMPYTLANELLSLIEESACPE